MAQNIPNLGNIWEYVDILFRMLFRMGDNGFSVEHTVVRARQKAGTLDRVVKYYQGAFKKAKDFLAASPSDDEGSYLLFFYFFSSTFPPLSSLGKGRNTAIFGSTGFIATVRPHGSSTSFKKNGFNAKNVKKINKNVEKQIGHR